MFRYLGFLLAGILIYRHQDKIVRWKALLASFTLGLTIAVVVNYIIKEPIIFRLWRTTSLPMVLYASAWVILFLLIPRRIFNGKVGNICSSFGRSTYTVFLAQMMYYMLIQNSIITELPVIASISVCSVIGYLWYLVDSKMQSVMIARNIGLVYANRKS